MLWNYLLYSTGYMLISGKVKQSSPQPSICVNKCVFCFFCELHAYYIIVTW